MGMRARRNPVKAIAAVLSPKSSARHKAVPFVASTLNSGGLPL